MNSVTESFEGFSRGREVDGRVPGARDENELGLGHCCDDAGFGRMGGVWRAAVCLCGLELEALLLVCKRQQINMRGSAIRLRLGIH